MKDFSQSFSVYL